VAGELGFSGEDTKAGEEKEREGALDGGGED